jgi:hypothetical protein
MPTALETAIAAEIAKLPAGIRKELATEKLAEYTAARAALTAAAGNPVVAYGFAGRNVQRMPVGEFRRYVAELEDELGRMIYGEVSLVDGRWDERSSS